MSDSRTSRREQGAARGLTAWLPAWALVLGLVLIVAGAVYMLGRPSLRRARAVQALNQAQVKIHLTEDGFNDFFGALQLESQRREFLDLLGYCHTEPALAKTVWQEALRNGTDEAKMLACHMAFYLAQEEGGLLDGADLDELMKLLEPAHKQDLRCSAQRALSDLLLLKDATKSAEYQKLPPRPASLKGEWAVRTAEETRGNATCLTIRWSQPEACLSWWGLYRGKAAWDRGLKRFVVGAPVASATP